MKHVVRLREAPHLRSMGEHHMRYEICRNDSVVGVLSYHKKGYVGDLPLADGSSLVMPEAPLSAYRKEITRINRAGRRPMHPATKAGFIAALRAELIERHGRPGGWAHDHRSVDAFLARTRRTIETLVNEVDINGSSFSQAWHRIGMTGKPTYRTLRALPPGR